MVYSLSEVCSGEDAKSHLPAEWPTYSLDNAAVGLKIGPITYEVDAEVFKRYAEVMGTEHPLYPTVPVKVESLLLLSEAQAKDPNAPGSTVNARMMLELHHPVETGDVLTSEGEVIALYERRGKPYVTTQINTVNQRGELVERLRKTRILSHPQVAQKWDFLQKPSETVYSDPVLENKSDDTPSKPHNLKSHTEVDRSGQVFSMSATDLSVGDRVAELLIDYSWEHITGYEFVLPTHMGIHNSFDAAQKSGFSQPFASGTMIVGHTVENLLPGVFGAGWTHNGRLNTVNIRPIIMDSKVLLTADVIAKLPAENDTLVVMKLTASLPEGDEVAVGTASALARG